ncbi:TetR/AcrR family transcriptional regulator [Salimicrobium sp. PL1-032A]|uniref:TetR/AcrR family transcriptional regulator n=1 Tax=Salimicrobium sp. PL1-032A TaxID=3095364 RepID=UPI0032612D57
MTHYKIIQISIDLFAETGYHNTSLSDIARGVGIKKPSLYNHFDSKDAIFLAVLEELKQRVVDIILQEITYNDKDTTEKKLYQIFDKYTEWMTDSKEGQLFKRLTFFPPEAFAEEIKHVFLQVEAQITETILPVLEQGQAEKHIRPMDRETLLSAFHTMMDGLFLEEHYYGKDVLTDRKKASWEIFWAGIRTDEGGV